METKISRSNAELLKHLREQCGFLQTSANLFDSKQLEEARRMATSIRLLVHDHKSSKSLLGQLGLKDIGFYDTSGPELKNVQSTPSFIRFVFRPNEVEIFPSLDRATHKKRTVIFEDWWEQPIINAGTDSSFSRKDIVLHVANKDGGAHIDPDLPKKYYDLTTGEALDISLSVGGRDVLLDKMELYCIRQVAYELLKSIEDRVPPNYDLSGLPPGLLPNLVKPITSSVGPEVKVGRNAPCPCNSGKKFKKCCGK